MWGGEGRTGGLRLGLPGEGTEMEKTSAPGTAVWLHLRPAAGDRKQMGGNPNLAQGPLPICSHCRIKGKGHHSTWLQWEQTQAAVQPHRHGGTVMDPGLGM